ncbi:GLPGLI family protein [Chryseobacterium cucumeris]|uniref:GLPGLI family protein n=1 Tax=Chryseobacterium TaxID=59732 RepID=UPI00288352CF|nr:GLPGLI family protein [Chryseobacterium sp. SG20098]WNI36455.1 GLPGLI family protein [Chryseobacterium sp. SG20098]
MRTVIIIFLLAFSFVNAQINRFIYEYQFIPDSTNKVDVFKEVMVLDISSKQSIYQSLQIVKRDSALKQIAKNDFNELFSLNRRLKRAIVSYQVIKEYPHYKTFLVDKIYNDTYKIIENEKLNWKIHSEKNKIGNFICQKATVDFGGRHWIAWFSELPFQDGPYKFHGLPGLIIKIEDTSKSHIMTMIANNKIQANFESDASGGEFITPQGGNFIIKGLGLADGQLPVIDESQFKKQWKQYLSDPSRDIRNMKGFITQDENGKIISDMREIVRREEERVKLREKQNNNKIEPSLYSN